jgi:hypothetical protein
MLTYTTLKDKARQFLAATGLTTEEFDYLLPAFAIAYHILYPADKTVAGKPRKRRPGAGSKGTLHTLEDKLLFILVYQKTYPQTYPLQTMQGLHVGLSQPQANYWIHHLLPVLQRALSDLHLTPERQASAVVSNALVCEEAPDLLLDGTERRRQRPQKATQQRDHYSGKKKAHTDKNLLLVNEHTGKVAYLGPTIPGKTHDKKAADEAKFSFPAAATLSKDTGFQGYEPSAVLTYQPKKSPEAKL